MNRHWSRLQREATRPFMLRNLRRTERWVRVLGGVVLMVLGLTLPVPFWIEELAETVGLLAAVTGAVGYCPVKHPFTRVGRGSMYPTEDEARDGKPR